MRGGDDGNEDGGGTALLDARDVHVLRTGGHAAGRLADRAPR